MDLAFHHQILTCQVWARGSKFKGYYRSTLPAILIKILKIRHIHMDLIAQAIAQLGYCLILKFRLALTGLLFRGILWRGCSKIKEY